MRFSLFPKGIGIDLGTANTLIGLEGSDDILLNEPSVVAIETKTGKVKAVGHEAKVMLGKTPNDIKTVRPMRDGVISDFQNVEKMIRYFINRVSPKRSIFKPNIVVGIPSDITEVERRAVEESCIQAGAKKVYLIEESLAAAIGANIDITEPVGNMIIDIGGGTTEISIISLSGMVISKSIRIGGDEIDQQIIRHIKDSKNLVIGETTAENIKVNFFDIWNYREKINFEIKGRDNVTGLPKSININKQELKEGVIEVIDKIVDQVKDVLDSCPPELASDIIIRGIVLTGGGAILKGIREYISNETKVPVIIAEDPLYSVVKGTVRYFNYTKN